MVGGGNDGNKVGEEVIKEYNVVVFWRGWGGGMGGMGNGVRIL